MTPHRLVRLRLCRHVVSHRALRADAVSGARADERRDRLETRVATRRTERRVVDHAQRRVGRAPVTLGRN